MVANAKRKVSAWLEESRRARITHQPPIPQS